MVYIKQQLKNNQEFDMSQVNDQLLNRMSTYEMVGTIQLLPSIFMINKKKNKIGSKYYITVQMYLDDNGTFKEYPRNIRAESIVKECNTFRMNPVYGDVFISKYYDDEENFRRMNFKLNECSSSADWIKEARIRNSFKQSNDSKILKSISCNNDNISDMKIDLSEYDKNICGNNSCKNEAKKRCTG